MIQQYGVPFLVWWTGIWAFTGVSFYGMLHFDLVEWPVIIGSLEAVGIGWLYRTMGGLLIDGLLGTVGLDSYFGLDSARLDLRGIDPSYGKVGLAVAVNETLEVVRFPIAVATIRPVLRLLGRLPK